MLKVYLAARYSRHQEMLQYAAELERLHLEVTSRWINGSHEGPPAMSVLERSRLAQEDWEDMRAADIVISFTEPPRSDASRGGRHVEFGAALALGKMCVVIGHRENVFHCLPTVVFWETWEEALVGLKAKIFTSGVLWGYNKTCPCGFAYRARTMDAISPPHECIPSGSS